MQAVDVLDAELPRGNAHDEGCRPPWAAKLQQKHVDNHACTLPDEDACVDIPHVHHLLWGNPSEHKREMRGHGVWLVGLWPESPCRGTPLLISYVCSCDLVVTDFALVLSV